MKIKAGITFLINSDGTIIEVRDENASMTFLKIKLTTKQLSQALSRLSCTSCEEAEVRGLDKLGLEHECKSFEFEISHDFYEDNRQDIAIKTVKKKCPKGWEPDLYFRSQGSFFERNGKQYACTSIKRWVKRKSK